MGKKVKKTTQAAEPMLQRDFRVSFSMNEKEYNAVCRYLDRYKITDKNRWFRETILLHVLQKMEEDHPTLFNENEMRR